MNSRTQAAQNAGFPRIPERTVVKARPNQDMICGIRGLIGFGSRATIGRSWATHSAQAASGFGLGFMRVTLMSHEFQDPVGEADVCYDFCMGPKRTARE